MLVHIVMMKLKEFNSSEKEIQLNMLIEKLSDLSQHISEIEKLEIGKNFSTRPTAMDVVLHTEFANEAALDAYRVHPEHVKVLALIKEIVAEARVVDYNK